jgi:hypothetical protein
MGSFKPWKLIRSLNATKRKATYRHTQFSKTPKTIFFCGVLFQFGFSWFSMFYSVSFVFSQFSGNKLHEPRGYTVWLYVYTSDLVKSRISCHMLQGGWKHNLIFEERLNKDIVVRLIKIFMENPFHATKVMHSTTSIRQASWVVYSLAKRTEVRGPFYAQ